MHLDHLHRVLSEATQRWVAVRVGYETLIFKCLSVMKEVDTLRIEAELKLDPLKEVPPHGVSLIQYVQNAPVGRTTIILEPHAVTVMWIYQDTKARPNDD